MGFFESLTASDVFKLLAIKLMVFPIAIAKKKGAMTLVYLYTFSMSLSMVSLCNFCSIEFQINNNAILNLI